MNNREVFVINLYPFILQAILFRGWDKINQKPTQTKQFKTYNKEQGNINNMQLLLLLYILMRQKKFATVPSKTHVKMTSSLWNKDSHGLYDYDSPKQNYQVTNLYIEQSTLLYRQLTQNNKTFLQTKINSRAVSSELTHIATVQVERKEHQSVFKFQPQPLHSQEPNSNPTRSFYHVLREPNPDTSTDPGYALKPGDIIKMGRVEYMVLEMRTSKEIMSVRDTSYLNDGSYVFEAPKPEGSEINCKVCLCNEETDTDPLIAPCMCKGSCQKIHVGCLKKWINSKVEKKINDIVYSYNFTKFQCEICKYPFPRVIKVDGKQVQMMTINKPDKPYIMLESLSNRALEGRQEQCLHLIAPKENNPIKIGRGHQCEIRITDISVSRSHAQIAFHDGKFYIKDQKSKFGTLIKCQEQSIVLQRDNLFKIQFGRTLYEFRVNEPSEDFDTE